jgi:hypothetical protein
MQIIGHSAKRHGPVTLSRVEPLRAFDSRPQRCFCCLGVKWILSSGDRKMVQSAVRTAFRFGGYFDVTNLSSGNGTPPTSHL